MDVFLIFTSSSQRHNTDAQTTLQTRKVSVVIDNNALQTVSIVGFTLYLPSTYIKKAGEVFVA